MKMKSPINLLIISIIGIQFLFSSSFLNAAEKKSKAPPTIVFGSGLKGDTSCLQTKKNEFKTLYLKLQQSLNYEGKDIEITNDKTGAFKLVPHKGEEYEGRIFEKKLFQEYQNSLRKVGLLYQAAKNDAASNSAEFNSNKELIDFMKAIDSGNDSKYIATTNIETVIKQLRKASEVKYAQDSKDPKDHKSKVINENDEYLLTKLLTHAQDRLCSIREYTKTKKGTRFFSAEEMEKKKNAPLNQLLLAVKDANLNKDSEINIVDTDVAINSAIQESINALTKWMSDNKSCKAAISSIAFMNSIQIGIQSCNYNEFINSLVITPDKATTDIERILHFINSNEKFLKKAAPKAETDLDEFKLQAFVDRTFSNNGTKIHCTEVVNSNKDGKRLFVRNLPYLDEKSKFDTSKIACKVKVAASKKVPASERTLTEQECAARIDLISDDLGRGIEVKQKNLKEAPISFSIRDNPECADVSLITPQAETPPLKPETPQIPAVWTMESCKILGNSKSISMILDTSVTPNTCIPEYDNAKCEKKGIDEKSPVKLIAKKDASGCEPLTSETDETCSTKGLLDTPPVAKILVNGKCELPAKKKKEECEKDGKDLASDELSCIEKKKEDKKEEESEADKECKVNNIKRAEDKGGIVTDWKVKDGKCIDTKADKSGKKKIGEKDEQEVKVRPEQPFEVPGRFVPIQIPTRQMYVLPGMP
ncbi:MAG: hypothetical protein H7336_15560 [Bacteriovorax sp.]|nr:hypothetical protein [Bacteriovorax sp.]